MVKKNKVKKKKVDVKVKKVKKKKVKCTPVEIKRISQRFEKSAKREAVNALMGVPETFLNALTKL